MFGKPRKMLFMLAIPALLIVAAEPAWADPMSDDSTSSLTFQLSHDTIFVEEMTGNDSLETAVVTFSVMFDSSFSPTDLLSAIECKIDFETDMLTLDSVVPTGNWDTTFTYQVNDTGDFVYMHFEHGSYPVCTTMTDFATLYFKMDCNEEGDSEILTFYKDNSCTNLLIAGTTFWPAYSCGSCYGDGSVTTADYILDFDFDDVILTDAYEEEFLVPVKFTSNYRHFASKHYIEYDTTRLTFLGVEDYDILYPDGCAVSGYPCPDSGDYPISLFVITDAFYPFTTFIPPLEDTVAFRLRFRVMSDEIWDGDTTFLQYVADSCYAYNWVDSSFSWYCPALHTPAAWSFDPDGGAVQLERYEAAFKAVADSNQIYPLSTDSKVWYTLEMENSFTTGIPLDLASLEGAVAVNFDLGYDDDLDYERREDLTDSALFFMKSDHGPALKSPGMSLSLTPHTLCIYEDYGNPTEWSNVWAAQDTLTGITQLEFEYTDSVPTPATYDDRFLQFGIISENSEFPSDPTTQVATYLLASDSTPLIVADSANGRLSWEVEPLEIGVADFYSYGGTGNPIYRYLRLRHNFNLCDFSITVTVGTNHYIDTIEAEVSGVLVEDLGCDSGYSCWRVYADSTYSVPATADSFYNVATIKYRCGVTVPCETYRYSTATFSDYWAKDAVDSTRYAVSTDEVTVATYGGSCPEPSCPVLFTGVGDVFVQENPLLTACEKSGYTEVVTDYYQVAAPVREIDGQIRFQLRELEDEITYLESLSLVTVDHTEATSAVCATDGTIMTYDAVNPPLSAIDHNGVDRLEQLKAEDDILFEAEGAGYLTVTFGTSGGRYGYTLSTLEKPYCPWWPRDPHDPVEKLNPAIDGQLTELKVEILDASGNWVELSDIPPRDQIIYEVVTDNPALTLGSETTTLRISWSNGYATDCIQQFVPSAEESIVRTLPIKSFSVSDAQGLAKTFPGFESGEKLVMVKGDILDFSFAVPDLALGMKRDYVICAVGRYQPDYSVLTGLLPRGYQLYDAYPNPFNPTTTLSYDLPAAAEVRLEIYNLLGQVVKTLVDEFQEAGHYTVEYNSTNDAGESVASGVYFYRLTTGDFTESKKMILVK